MVRATDSLAEAGRIDQLAGRSTVERDWDPVARRIRDDATDDWHDDAAVRRFESTGGRFVRGAGRLAGTKRVVVDSEEIDVSKAIVIATGTQPRLPEVDGLDGVAYWTNRGAVAATEVPDSLVIVGAGAVGCEFAQVFARFGSRVTLLEGEAHVLPSEEREACMLLHEIFAADGIDVRAQQAAVACSTDGDSVTVGLDNGATVSAEKLLVATGRKADLASIATSTIGVDEDQAWIPVDDHLRVKGAPGVWAIGDVVGGGFTHVAVHHARIAAADILGRPGPGTSDKAIPRVTFTDPEVGAVASSARGWIHKVGNEGFIKLVEDRSRGVLVGATSMGPVGGEVLSMLILAIEADVRCDDLRHMIYAYPTFHRAVEDALRDLDIR